MSRRLHVGPIALTAAGAVVVIGTFLPWLRSGSLTRSSYDLLGLFDRIDLAEDGVVSWLVRWWPVVPLLVTVAVLLGWGNRHRLAVATAVLVSVYAGGVGTVLVIASRGTPVRLGAGPWVTAFGSVLLVAAAVLAVVVRPARPVRSEAVGAGSVPSPHADP